MGTYKIEVKQTARKDLQQILKSGDKSIIKKVEEIFQEIEDHPSTVSGKPEQMRF